MGMKKKQDVKLVSVWNFRRESKASMYGWVSLSVLVSTSYMKWKGWFTYTVTQLWASGTLPLIRCCIPTFDNASLICGAEYIFVEGQKEGRQERGRKRGDKANRVSSGETFSLPQS